MGWYVRGKANMLWGLAELRKRRCLFEIGLTRNHHGRWNHWVAGCGEDEHF